MGSCKSLPEYQDPLKNTNRKIRYGNRCIPTREDALRTKLIYGEILYMLLVF